MDQSNLLKSFKEFVDKSRPNTTKGKNKKEILLRLVNALYEGQELTINAFKSGIFPIKSTQGEGRPSDLARVAKVFECTR